jgi:hypothetical protein
MRRIEFKSFYTEEKSFAVAFNPIFWSMGDVLPINNDQFHLYVDSIYPKSGNQRHHRVIHICSVLQLVYLVLLLKLDANGKLTTQLYNKQDDFNFSIVNFPHLYGSMYIVFL